MGGRGSGRKYMGITQTTTEDVRRLDLRYLKRHDLLRPGYVGTLSWSQGGDEIGSIGFRVMSTHLLLSYRYQAYRGAWEDVEERVELEWTSCHYGGQRPWLRCPQCVRRVVVLYGYGRRFLCRHCYGLPYASQLEMPIERLMRKAQKIRERLGADLRLSIPIEKKPKGMHWATFERLALQEEIANDALWWVIGDHASHSSPPRARHRGRGKRDRSL